MSSEIEDLVRRLEPIIGREQAQYYLQNLNDGRFLPTLKKAAEREIKELARQYDLDNQITIYPVPKKSAVSGGFSLGFCHYANRQMNAMFGLRSPDFIKHVGIFGATGSGKTTTAMRVIRLLCEQGKPFLILDPKGTWQSIIRKPWAKDVKILKLGLNYTFDPFVLMPGMDRDTMISDVVEVFCDSQYLGFGAKNLLFRAITNAGEQLNLRSVFEGFLRMDPKVQKEKSWYVSTMRALESATSGVLGRVLNSPDNVPFEKMMNSQVVIVMDSLVDPDQISMFNGLMLNRIYWFRKIAGIKERFEHLLVLEEFHAMSKAEKGESRIDFLIKMCREFSQGVMILDQNPGDISQQVLGNLNTIISMNLGHSRDINAISTAMVLKTGQRDYLGMLPTGSAICRVKDRFPESVLVKIIPEYVKKTDITPEDMKIHNGDFVQDVPPETMGSKPIESEHVSHVTPEDKLGTIPRKILRFLKISNAPNLKVTYLSHGLSYRRGNSIRDKLESLGLVESKKIHTETGHETRLYLTEKGYQYLENTEDSRRLGGDWHRSAVNQVAYHYRSRDFKVFLEYRDMDVFVDKGTEKLAVEVESLSSSKDYVHAVYNAVKALKRADRLEIVVKDRKSARKLKEALRKSPVNKFAPVKIMLLEHYH